MPIAPKLHVVHPETRIAVPSYGRARVKGKGCTRLWISPEAWKNTTYYVEPEEREEYESFLQETGAEIANAGEADFPKHWGSIMDLIIDRECQRCDHLIIMDDDLKLDVRPDLPSKPTSFVPMTPEYFDEMIRELRSITTEKCPLTSAQYRQFCQGKTKQHEHNQRISMIWSLHAPFFRDHPEYRFYRPSKLDFMSDYYFFIKLLVDGYPNVCINKYVKDDRPNAPGGESSKRSMDVFNRAARQLAGMFPEIVTTRVKTGKNAWQDGMLGVIIAVRKTKAVQQGKSGSLG